MVSISVRAASALRGVKNGDSSIAPALLINTTTSPQCAAAALTSASSVTSSLTGVMRPSGVSICAGVRAAA
ncbi:hypothetical protein A5714_02605 [Mycobacterium sp. E2462]|nr:hypothetical protein A5714_02605 [Mycobacterium sp. E2462]